MKKPKNIGDYILSYPIDQQKKLAELYACIVKAAPLAEELISYGMPAFKYNGMLLYFAGHKNHIGFYPFRSAITTFQKELSVYKGSVGTVQFLYEKKLPLGLIRKIIKFRVNENQLKKKKNRGIT